MFSQLGESLAAASIRLGEVVEVASHPVRQEVVGGLADLRRHEQTGRPLGGPRFVKRLEKSIGAGQPRKPWETRAGE